MNYPDEIRYPSRRLYWREQSAWFQRMSEKGWIAPNWPARYGGMGLAPSKLLIFFEEQERWGIARFQDQGVRMIGPALFEHGTEDQQRRFLPGILSCEHRYCQGYSEPCSGSDLSSLRTTARRDGDEYIVNGSKIWTTMAHDVTHMMLLARTAADVRQASRHQFPHRGALRPWDYGAADHRYCRPSGIVRGLPRGRPNSLRDPVGEENHGWEVANTVLRSERIHIGSPQLPAYGLESLGTLLPHAIFRTIAHSEPSTRSSSSTSNISKTSTESSRKRS